ncbi:hypothetical protein EV702DRAFT_1201936 [Suillus placidus]|uniref:Uncharacterized protein n=1 Tax=Suillus placidus TaxID=48579 RepID=A0A9P7CYY5_9AGAM|nr:hypothetical protein EV702DRAFT_1201936 [Suillus placidus]
MSHLSAQLSDNSSDDDFDESNNQVSIPGPNASKGEFMEALKALQLEVQRLRKDNRALKENNKVLLAKKPKRKRRVEAPDELVAHEQTISLYARKYGMTVETFPDSELLTKKCPDSPTPFNSQDHYKTVLTQESAFLDELYAHFLERIHRAMESVYFKDLVNKSISDARSNEIKKLRGVAGDIFDLPAKYFTNPSHDRAGVIEIQKMLGVSGKTQAYKIFPPLLFPGLQEDPTLKSVFSNWILFAKILRASLHGITLLHQEPCGGSKTNARKWSFQQVTPGSIAWAAVIAIFLLSPDTEFPGSGAGKSSTINYKDLFYQYKKMLVMKWDTRRIKNIVDSTNNHVFGAAKLSTLNPAGGEDFSEEINRAMLALDMSSDSEADKTLPALSALSAVSSAPVSSTPVSSAAP